MRIFIWAVAVCVLLVAGYYVWGYTGKDYASLHTTTASINIISDSTSNGKGNLLGIQPFLTASDYCDQQHFHDALFVYFKKAQAAGLLQANTIVVLPENIGSWLAFANEKTTVYQSDSMKQAVSTIVNSNIFIFIKNLLAAPADDKIKHAFVYMKAALMVKIYTAVFSSLAKEFKVTIAAGSLILPQPSLDARGRIHIKKGQLYYSSFIFNPEGNVQARPVLKALPDYNGGETTIPPDSNLSIAVQTPAGAVVVTAEESAGTNTFNRTGKLTAGIFLNGTDKVWNAVWKGENGFAIPLEAIKKNDDTSFFNTLLLHNTTSSQLIPSAAGARVVIHNGFTGNLWEISYKNRLSVLHPIDMMLDREPVKQQGIIVNFWFR